MKSTIQQYFQDGGKLEDLTSNLGIKCITSSKYPSLIQFKYSQIDSPANHPLVINARGLILDSQDNWKVIAWPFNRFFNYGDGHAAEIDWDSACVQTKEDGSLQIFFFYDGRWNIATSGTIDADANINIFPITFKDLFWQTFKKLDLIEPKGCNISNTYMFELVSPYNKQVVQYTEPNLIFIGQRDTIIGEEHSIYDNEYYKHIAVKRFQLSDIESILKSLPDLEPTAQEGYVVVDKFFNRLKIKSPQYVSLHHMKDGFGNRRAAEIVRNSEIDEIIAYFPEYREVLENTKAKYDALVNELEIAYERIKDIPVQKDFALEALKSKCSGALFSIRAKKFNTFKDYLADINIKSFMEILKIKDNTPENINE
jgi:hypothetical protein